MGKLGWFKFYPGDWMKDPELRVVSSGARGLWIDMLSLMFECDRRGYLKLNNGKIVSAEYLARMTGNSTDDTSHWLQELENSGVFSRSDDGCIYSRRQVRDERERSGVRERVTKHRSNTHVTGDVTPLSVSVSVSEVAIQDLEPKPEEEFFDSQQATTYVFLEVGLAGTEARMLVKDAVDSFIHNRKVSPRDAAESLVSLWNQYQAAEIEFKKGVFKFFKEGLWKHPEDWDQGNGKAKSKSDEFGDRAQKERDIARAYAARNRG